MRKRYTRDEFINYVGENKDNFNGYCEILIDSNGLVIIATPSHQVALVDCSVEDSQYTKYQIWDIVPNECDPTTYLSDRFNYVVVWYNGIIVPYDVNMEQIETINLLMSNNIISKSPSLTLAHEYKHNVCISKLFVNNDSDIIVPFRLWYNINYCYEEIIDANGDNINKGKIKVKSNNKVIGTVVDILKSSIIKVKVEYEVYKHFNGNFDNFSLSFNIDFDTYEINYLFITNNMGEAINIF